MGIAKKIIEKSALLLAVIALAAICAVPVSAAPRSKWVTNKKGVTCYYDKQGKKVTGLYKIKKNQYYFDKSGTLLHGWRKVKLNGKWSYCYFSRKKGAMQKKTIIHGYSIGKNGAAYINASNRKKMRMMVRANEVVDKITKPAWSNEKKLAACFRWVCTFPGATLRQFTMQPDWGSIYAKDILFGTGGNCFSLSSAFAFLANSIGYKAYVCTDTIHGWAEINGLVYDPALYVVNKSTKYYGCPYEKFETKKAAALRI